MNRLTTTMAAAFAAVTITASATAAHAAPTSPTTWRCATIRVTGDKVPVTDGPEGHLVRYVKHNQKLKSCYTQGVPQRFHACGDWTDEYWIVHGGTIPLTCARKL
ncbi:MULTISPECIES: hypothetical protein [unclassified Streptomyces]|uniref:hypothetical protein n=1 Tax=unclassified Streptomyces TaxID=2593676 RepID=UPI002DDB23CC|nr:hypothetical protein [Streptomyces sp. NBC_01766]WSC24911.1 hypothetical protein OIE60_35170 [Streptomyces sp. NBC_01766]